MQQAVPSNAVPGARRWPVWQRLACGTLFALVALALAELALRLADVGYPVSFFLPAPQGPGLIPNDAFGRRFRCPDQPVPFYLPAPKPAGMVRLFVLGESAAAGVPDPAYSVSRILHLMLAEQFPGAPVEVHNAAMMGINSHAIRQQARECVAQGADVLVLYAGNNELIGTHGVNSTGADWTPGAALAFMRAGLWLRTIRLGQWVDHWTGERALEQQRAEVQDAAYFLAHRVAAGDQRRATIAESFRANLDDICALAASPGGPQLVFATVAVNLRDCAPFGSLHRAGFSVGESNRWAAAFRRGCTAQAAARWPEALRHFTAAIAVDAQHAEAFYRFGLCHLAAGDQEAARLALRMARDLDALPFRADTVLNDTIREAAAGRAGVTLVDAEQRFEAAAQGLPGADFFYEHVHFRWRGNYTLARVLFPAVMAAVGAKLGRAPRAPAALLPEAECARRLAFTAWDEIKLQRAMVQLFTQHAFDGQMDGPARMAAARGELQRLEALFTEEERQRAQAVYATALERAPQDWFLRHNYAELLMELGRQREAADQWRQVVAQFPRHHNFRLYLAMSLLNAGDRVAAAQQLQEILRAAPEHRAAQRLWSLAATPR